MTSEAPVTADTKKKSEKAPDRAVRLLIQGILDGTYPPGSDLPGERDLCKSLGVARPALREALQRLSHDGWLIIQQGKPTRVSLFMRDGSLNVLIGLLQADITLLPDFVTNLLDIWALMAPAPAARCRLLLLGHRSPVAHSRRRSMPAPVR